MDGFLFPKLSEDLDCCIVKQLPPNEVACTLRLVCKAAAASYSDPEHRAVRLSQPVPQHAFRHRIEAEGGAWLRSLSYLRRLEVVCLAAASGDVSHLKAAVAAAGCVLVSKVMESAARAGHLHVCQWLAEQRCPFTTSRPFCSIRYNPNPLTAMYDAAREGHWQVCEWLLAQNNTSIWTSLVRAAAEGGQMHIVERLQSGQCGRIYSDSMYGGEIDVGFELLRAAAAGGNLVELQQLHAVWQGHKLKAAAQRHAAREHRAQPHDGREAETEEIRQGHSSPQPRLGQLLGLAAGGHTPDWRAKVEWLEGEGLLPSRACIIFDDVTSRASRARIIERIEWLVQRGYPVDGGVVIAAAKYGNLAALRFLLDGGGEVQLRWDSAILSEEAHMRGLLLSLREYAFNKASEAGHLAVLQLLHGYGLVTDPTEALLAAARGGHVEVVVWLVEVFGQGVSTGLQDWRFWRCGAKSGSLELLEWMHRQGLLKLESETFTEVVSGGCVAAVERLVEYDYPRPADEQPYIAALERGDLAMVRCLRRMGCPWNEQVFTGCTQSMAYSMYGTSNYLRLQALLAEGCPVDWDKAKDAASRAQDGRLVDWLEEEHQRREMSSLG